ncbi:hypothetical protein GF348_03705, partial [candidate division KSB3 bacterium]|nr:hypothetical protein [candidate division KSB3 bacterium]
MPKKMIVLISLAVVILAQPVWAGKGEINFVETAVDLHPTGAAVVAYTVQWQVISGELHGFYFQGNDRLRVNKISDQSYAVDSAGNRYALDISNVGGGKWDIILADGQGVASGTVTYVFYFETDFAEADYLAATTTDDGQELVVFNWSPVQWDEAARQDHYTLLILTPETLPEGQDPRQYVEAEQLILTEPWVNEKFLIDYQRGPNDRLQLIFHKNAPGNRFDMRTQFYMPAAWFDLPQAEQVPTTTPSSKPTPITQEPTLWQKLRRDPLLLGMIIIGVVFSLIAIGKQRSMVSAHKGLDEVRWDNLDWTPPKLVLSNFHKPGKICKDLTFIEAAFYLELPLKRVLSGMLNSMVAEGYLRVYSEEPLRVEILQEPDLDQLDEYERMFYAA